MDSSLSDTPDLDRLRGAELTVVGALAGASNHTLLVQLGNDQRFGVYKPRMGERPLWDFPPGTLCKREVAAYLVSALLGWDLVPPTVLREGPFGVGSVQLFVLHDPAQHYFTLVDEPALHPRLAQLAVFDLLINNADRKGGHVLRIVDDDRLVGIDHGLTFHVEPKLRTVIWDLGGTALDPGWRADLQRLCNALASRGGDVACFDELLGNDEIAVLRRRAELLAGSKRLPDVAPDRRPYPWPPL